MNSQTDSPASEPTADVPVAVTRERFKLIRVQTVNDIQNLLPFLGHNEWVSRYAMNNFRDPDTLILQYGRSCVIVSVVRHDLFKDTAVIAWAQNPDLANIREMMKIVSGWAESRGCPYVAAYVAEDGELFGRLKAVRRLVGLKPYRILLSTAE